MGSTRASIRAQWLVMAALAVAASGCHTVTPFGSINTLATGGQNYVAGMGTQTYPASEAFVDETRKTLDDLNVRAVARRREAEMVVFEGKDSKGRSAVVRIVPVAQATKMRVHARFGVFGDETLTRAFLDRLSVRVGEIEGEDRARVQTGEASPELTLRPRSADAPPGSLFQRRLEEGVREIPTP
jgi:hypothetical protein